MSIPKFKKTSNAVDNPFLDLGVELSSDLPTFDVPVDLITPSDSNPNDMDDEAFNRLVQELEDVGFIEPIQIVPSPGGKFKIIAGEHRWRGARTMGMEKVPCNVLTGDRFMDEDLQELLMVRMNVLHGKINPEKFQQLYKNKEKKYGADQLKALFGYTSSDAWKKVTKGLSDSIKTSGVPGSGMIADEIERRSKNIRSVNGLGNILRDLMKQFGEDLKHGFMFFVYGGKRHLYIIMDDQLHEAVNIIANVCRKSNTDIGEVMSGIIRRHIEKGDGNSND